MMTIEEVKRLIEYESFRCLHNKIECSECPFDPGFGEFCGGHADHFDWEKIKKSKTVTMKTLIKFKTKTNKLKYPKLCSK